MRPIEQVPTEFDLYDMEKAVNAPTPRYHIQLAKLEQYTREQKLEILGWYEGGTRKKFGEVVNRILPIYGIIIHYHPPYLSYTEKDKDGNPLKKAGYEQILFRTGIKDENDMPIIIACSAGALASHVRAILAIMGWYKWSHPINYRFYLQTTTHGTII